LAVPREQGIEQSPAMWIGQRLEHGVVVHAPDVM
jgi:hypothetical protein